MNEKINLLLANHIKSIAKENDIDPEIVKNFLLDAIKKIYNKVTYEDNLEISFDLQEAKLTANKVYEVVDDNFSDFDEYLHISINDPKLKDTNLKIGDFYKEPFLLDKEFGQHQVQQILQSFKQKIIEISNQRVYNSWSKMINEVVLAEIEKEDNKAGFFTIDLQNVYDKNGDKLENTLGFLGKKELNPYEKLKIGKKYHFVISNVKEQSNFCPVILSRASEKLVEYYMSLEIPEIDDGTIKIIKSARQPGVKTKVIVDSKTLPTQPAAVCVGPRGDRIKNISAKLSGEKIEIYNYSENPYLLLSQIVTKQGIVKIAVDQENKNAILVVNDDELSKAIGKKGCNVKLASMISGYNIEVVKISDFDPNDYDEKFTDINSSEFNNLNNNVVQNNKDNLTNEQEDIDEIFENLNQSEEISELNNIFVDEIKQIIDDEKEKL